MTTVIAFQGPDFAILGADSQITDGDRIVLSPSTPKIVKVGKYLLGVRGDARAGDVLMYSWKPPLYDGTDPVKFMGKKIIPSIIAAFRANSYDFDKDGAMFGFILAFAGNVFEIGSDMSISQNIDGIYAIGSGSDYALGVMQYALAFERGIAAATAKSVTEAIECALTISAKYDINTSAPFQIEVQRV
jgi:ATP-dependent protease HslVU (ClpYQ) peptidase subunit